MTTPPIRPEFPGNSEADKQTRPEPKMITSKPARAQRESFGSKARKAMITSDIQSVGEIFSGRSLSPPSSRPSRTWSPRVLSGFSTGTAHPDRHRGPPPLPTRRTTEHISLGPTLRTRLDRRSIVLDGSSWWHSMIEPRRTTCCASSIPSSTSTAPRLSATCTEWWVCRRDTRTRTGAGRICPAHRSDESETSTS